MTLWQRVSPWAPVSQLRREVDRLFGDFLPEVNGGERLAGGMYPAVNVWDEGEHLIVEAEVPGLEMKDVEVLMQGAELTIRGERRLPTSDEGKRVVHRRERREGKFVRTIVLPIDIAVDRIEAKLSNGVLTITLPKAESAKARRIEVKGG